MSSLGKFAFINEKNSADVVLQRLRESKSTALGGSLPKIVKHLHAAVLETRPTSEQFRNFVRFLTEVGHACDDSRQEWVLLFDVLGISMLVEEINCARPPGATRNTLRGPFYRSDAPPLPLGANICLDGKGEPLAVRGMVIDLDGNPISGAIVETWQANGDGIFENQQPDLQPEFNLRGVFKTDAEGRFHYRTIRPGGYSVPDDGPVGELLASLDYELRRPANLQFQISAKGYETITTHVYDGSDPIIYEDALFSVRPELIGEFLAGDSESADWQLEFQFVMARKRRGRMQ